MIWRKQTDKIEQSLWDLWENIKISNICIIGFQRWGKIRAEKIFKNIRAENFKNGKRQKTYRFKKLNTLPKRINSKNFSPKDIIIKLGQSKAEDKILRVPRTERHILLGWAGNADLNNSGFLIPHGRPVGNGTFFRH